MKNALQILCLSLICIGLTACTYAISSELRDVVQPEIGFSSVANSPEAHTGEQFIWGGTIVSGRVDDTGTYLEIVQSPVDGFGNIIEPDYSEGRFIAYFPGEFLDPAIYSRDRHMTLGGTLIKVVTGKIADRDYRFPLLEVAESQLWKVADVYFRDGFGSRNSFPWPRDGHAPPY